MPTPQDTYSQIVKLGVSRQVVIPKKIFDNLKLKAGEYLEVQQEGKRVVMKPKTMFDKELEEGLAQSFADFKAGRSYGPFDTAEEMIKSLHEGVKRIRSERKKAKFHRKS